MSFKFVSHKARISGARFTTNKTRSETSHNRKIALWRVAQLKVIRLKVTMILQPLHWLKKPGIIRKVDCE